MSIGRNSSYAPDYMKAKQAAARLFSFIDRVPDIDVSSGEGEVLVSKTEYCCVS
jgi:hypothetical protein